MKKNLNTLKRKHLLLALVLIIMVSCKHKAKFDRVEKYYEDYDLYSRKGVTEINEAKKNDKLKQGKVFFDIIYHGKKLDTIIIYNLFKKNEKIIFSVIQNDSVSVFKTFYSYSELTRQINYYVFCNKYAINYQFNIDEIMNDYTVVCNITSIRSNSCNGGRKLIKVTDTIGFTNKLLSEKDIPVYKSLTSTTYSNRLNQGFTFMNWFDYKNGKIIH